MAISVFGYEKKYISKLCMRIKTDLLLIGEEVKITMLLSKILLHLYMITQFTMEENIFVVIVYKLLLQKY